MPLPVVLDGEFLLGVREVEPGDEPVSIEDPVLGLRCRQSGTTDEQPQPGLWWRFARSPSASPATSRASRLPPHLGSAATASRTPVQRDDPRVHEAVQEHDTVVRVSSSDQVHRGPHASSPTEAGAIG